MPTSSEHMHALGELYRALRERVGLGISEAARGAGMSRVTWSDAEHGKKTPQGGTLDRMDHVVGLLPGTGRRVLAGELPADASALLELRDKTVHQTGHVDVVRPSGVSYLPGDDDVEEMHVRLPESFREIIVFANRDDVPLTGTQRAQLAQIAIAEWLKANPESQTDIESSTTQE